MTLDRDDDGVPLHDSEEDRAASAARRLTLRDAAPDLLDALVGLLAKYDEREAQREALLELWPVEAAKARTAIAKATGGKP